MKQVVEINNLHKKFGKTIALEDVSFTVNEGEVVGFIGPNGAGKSTTIRILLGLIKSSGGTATIFNEDVWQKSISIHQKIAYVPGDIVLWPSLSGGEIIDLFMKLHGNGSKEKRDYLIKRFDFDPKKKAKTYSKGNRQKVGLIAALACEAELYIFDEPTSGLDPIMETVFQEEVEKLKNQGKAILLSSHILSEVEKLADKIVIIRKGKIVESGSLEDMRHLTRILIEIETKQDVNILKEVKGLNDFKVSENENKATFSIASNLLNDVLKVATKLEIVRLEATPPTLEDLFLTHYQNQ